VAVTNSCKNNQNNIELLESCTTVCKDRVQQRITLFIYLLTEHLHLKCNITAGQQGTNK